nr:carboxypeptidase regulatory-like domain-containing protein [Acidobacteriota bacterium]
MTKSILALLFPVMLLSVDAAAQQPRDNQRRVSSGTATITGVVMSAESQPRPLRRVRVRISGTELEISQSTITTDDGRFAFDSLPAGRYTVSAVR